MMIVNLLLASFLLTSTAPLDDRLSIELKSATAEQTFSSFASILGVELDLHPDVEKTVSIGLENVTLRTALTAACESVFANWKLTDSTLEIFPEESEPSAIDSETPATELSKKIDLALEDAPASASFRALGKILQLAVVLDPELADRPITANLASVPLSEVLDNFCSQIACDWNLEDSELMVTAR